MIISKIKNGLNIMENINSSRKDILNLKATPIFVECIGRTGSTMLMNLLGTSEQIRFEKQYPFENRIFSNLLQIAKMFQADFNPKAPHNFMINENKFFSTVAFTKNQLFDKESYSKKAFKLLFESAILDDKIIKEYTTLYYAEKTPYSSDMEDILGNFTKKHIFLYRDPRAVIVSSNKFNIKRGFVDFWWQEGDNYYSYLQKNIGHFKEQLEKALKYTTDSKIFVVKYEDMVENPVELTDNLNDWLELKQSKIDYQKVSQIKYHMTNNNSGDSIEAWKNELDRTSLHFINNEIGSLLEKCGYKLY